MWLADAVVVNRSRCWQYGEEYVMSSRFIANPAPPAAGQFTETLLTPCVAAV